MCSLRGSTSDDTKKQIDSGLASVFSGDEERRSNDKYDGSPEISIEGEKVPSCESNKELMIRIPSPMMMQEGENIDEANKEDVLNVPIVRRNKGSSKYCRMKRSKSLTSAVERAVFRKFTEKLISQNK